MAVSDKAKEAAQKDVGVTQLGHAFAVPAMEGCFDFGRRRGVALYNEELTVGRSKRHGAAKARNSGSDNNNAFHGKSVQ
jgi:hypothetical protein